MLIEPTGEFGGVALAAIETQGQGTQATASSASQVGVASVRE
jgi:hypothetical protein